MEQENHEPTAQQITIKTLEFIQVDSQLLNVRFYPRNITSQTTKFYNVIESLPPKIVAKIPNNILHTHYYDELKNSLIVGKDYKMNKRSQNC